MKQRIADYIADFLVSKGVTDCFTVVGGGAMHLNDAFGHHEGLHVTCCHHEQACAIAAEGFTRLHNVPALVCVTTGPGGTNAMTGVVGAYLDSIPMIVISGQVRYDTTAHYDAKVTGLPAPRAVGDQEFGVVPAAQTMTKYARLLDDPMQIRTLLEEAWSQATTGRPGPVWLDIPVNFQGMVVETDDLPLNNPPCAQDMPAPFSLADADRLLDMIANAERPVIYAGGGVRLSGGFEVFRRVVERLNVPVVTYWNSIDLIETDHELYCGRGGNMGDRAGNFAVQNADLVLAIGTRLSIRQVGYTWNTWARCARVVMVDIDPAELKKHTLHVDWPIHADAKQFMEALQARLPHTPVFRGEDWIRQCQRWKQKYPVALKQYFTDDGEQCNVYAFIHALSAALPEGSLTAVSNGACCVAGHQTYVIKNGTRFVINNAIASMGYGLPAAVGLCIAGGRKPTVCLEGDGSIMMNLQELQTIATNNLPIKVFLINNNGYHSIRITQNNLFSHHSKVGIGPESGDLGFPDFKLIAAAFGFRYEALKSADAFSATIARVLDAPGPVFCEVFTDTRQTWEPKSSARREPDGSLTSPPLEDLAPFLPREELLENLYIPPCE